MASSQLQEFEVNIRDPSGRAQLVRVHPTWTVRHVKEQFSRQTGIPVEQFRLIFAGQQLLESRRLEVIAIHHSKSSVHPIPSPPPCSLLLQEFGLQSYSTLHCVRGRGLIVDTEVVSPTASVREVERMMATVDGKEQTEGADRFFVFCKSCGKMTKGKLRVRCASCRNPAFILNAVRVTGRN